MTINIYVKKWCDEEYDVRKEDFYVENAHYITDRCWALGGLKHGTIALFVSFAIAIFSATNSTIDIISNALVNLGILTTCFWLFGIRQYNANSPETSFMLYLMTAVMLFVGKNKAPISIQYVSAVASCILFVYLSIVRPIKFIPMHRRMKKRMVAEEKEEEEASAQSYSQWEHSYKAFRYGLPESEQQTVESDPEMIKARQLFEGYQQDKQMLKTRYRQLAKQYHPDKGGDTKLFQCIITVYEELCQNFA
jgi:hypothetical protein